MLSRTHAASAAVAAGPALHVLRPSQAATFFMTASAVIGSIVPDIDTTTSKISRTCLTAQCTSILLEDYGGHRGITHTPFFIGITGLVGSGIILKHYASDYMIIFSYTLLPLLFGMGIHLLLDAFTPMGIMLLYPFDKTRFSFMKNNKDRICS